MNELPCEQPECRHGMKFPYNLVRSGFSLALAPTDEDEIQDQSLQLQASVTTYSAAVEPPEKAAHAAAGH